MTKGYADIPEGQVSYRTEGSGEPVLLLHQTPFSYEEYSQVIPILAKSYRVVAMERLGLGYSDNPPREYEVEDYARSVVNFLDALGIKKTSIVGHHTGSSVGIEVAAAYPERVDKLILSACPFMEPEEWKKHFAELWSRLSPPAEDGLFLMDWWDLFYRSREFSTQNKPELILKPLALMLDSLTRPYFAQYAVSRYDVKQRLPLIKSPTLVMFGSEEMLFDKLEVIKSLIPRSKTKVIEDASILICFEKPDEFAQAILDFLKNPGV